jgi:methylthioribose-1-phosphate isomerase
MTAGTPAQQSPAAPVLHWDGRTLRALDQTRLPFDSVILELRDARETADAIRRLAIRGAPLIGVAAGYGLAMEVSRDPTLGGLERGWEVLRDARPTAANLAWAVDRVREAALRGGPTGLAGRARAEAEAIEAEETAGSVAMAGHGADLLASAGATRVMTHCNSGVLAAPGRGTGLGVIAEHAERTGNVFVIATETRPLLQGARLTAWELDRLGIPFALTPDSAAAALIARGEVDAVVTGFDRVAANGDVANKVGTYALALAAHAAGIPYFAVGPTSSIDLDTPSGGDIVIEERAAEEVLTAGGTPVARPGTAVRNPAFDVTPASLVSGLVTERGVARPVNVETVGALLR